MFFFSSVISRIIFFSGFIHFEETATLFGTYQLCHSNSMSSSQVGNQSDVIIATVTDL